MKHKWHYIATVPVNVTLPFSILRFCMAIGRGPTEVPAETSLCSITWFSLSKTCLFSEAVMGSGGTMRSRMQRGTLE